MNLIIVSTYIVLSGTITVLLVLMLRNREKENIEIHDAMLGPEELERHAVETARDHVTGKSSKTRWLVPRINENFKYISDAYKALNNDARNMVPTVPAAEWLLDNFYVIEEQFKDIRNSLSKEYYAKLPILKNGYLRGYPRVFAIALELVSHTDGRVDEKVLLSFIKAYQSQSLLSIGELWAVAIMVRIALLENIRHICEKIMESQQQWRRAEKAADLLAEHTDKDEAELIRSLERQINMAGSLSPSFVEHLLLRLRKKGAKLSAITRYFDTRLAEHNLSTEAVTSLEHQLQAATQISMGNTVTSLRMASTVDWTDIFESLSHVENILSQDPAGIYREMDFESRDYYRHMVEKLSRLYRISEMQVARKAVECASQASGESPDGLASHVGYYIAGKGMQVLHEKLGNNPMGYKVIVQAIKGSPKTLYFGSIAVITIILTVLFICYSVWKNGTGSVFPVILAGLAVLIPVSDLSMVIVNSIVSHLYNPTIFPKLELKKGIPGELSSMVIVPTLLPSEKRVKELLGQLEIFYLANRERNIFFALVGDYKDADRKDMPEDRGIANTALEGVRELNKKYASEDRELFFYFHRHRQYNEAQQKWMGWERKRGAIIEFNSFLRGNRNTSYSITSSNPSKFVHIKYIITLDADTNLPMGAARRLIGTLAHPMNRAVVDTETGKVTSGYGLLQPRIGVSVTSANSTPFTRIFAGQGGIDPYTTAVSDVYQDLFGEGIFTGKGIYEVDVFLKILADAIPENTVLSHDLLEGCYIRAGLVTDIELIDGYPARYNSYAMRLHRWVRGDWQLLPWLCGRVRDRGGNKVKNPLSVICKWKIFDNMRRSLVNPALIFLVLLGLSILPGNRLVWLGLAVITAASPVISHIMNTLMSSNYRIYREKRHSTIICGFKAAVLQTALLFTFIPYQAYLMSDAVLRTLVRVLFTRRHMLEWVTAADMEASLRNDLRSFWRRMWICPASGAAAFILSVLYSFEVLPLALIVAVIWTAAPYAAYVVSKPVSVRETTLSDEELQKLRKIARQTWRFFEDFAGERENFLPPDNFQMEPLKGVAHRTSPTNIGLLLLSTLCARDMGFIGTAEMSERIESTITSIERMEKWRGHLYNWYDTTTLEVLKPRYVSTVDSGNLIGYLMVLETGLKEYLKKPLADMNLARGLMDTAKLLNNEENNEGSTVDLSALEEFIRSDRFDPVLWKDMLDSLLSGLNSWDGGKMKKSQWGGKLLQMAGAYRDELAVLLPASNKQDRVLSLMELRDTYGTWMEKNRNNLENEVIKAAESVERLIFRFEGLIKRIHALIHSMEFAPLFDPKIQLFSIGYNVEEGHLSKSYYDLLASEARQASYIAVARGEVDRRHWFRLGRKLVRVDGYKGLVSWTGTMFEYLMPLLIMRSFENTLLDETYHFVLRNQKKHGEQRKIPWGVSESGYNAFDIGLNYQYKAFGVSELGLKRGLENDVVIAPYAALLAVGIDPLSVMQNVERLENEGVNGLYGFFEAVDYTPSRLKKNETKSIVKSYMAHHQGMSLAALNNFFNGNVLQTRFHTDPLIKSAELLLQERIPAKVLFTKDSRDVFMPARKSDGEGGEVVRTFGVPDSQLPHVHILSNGSYSVMLTNGGSGYSRSNGIAVTRWRENLRQSSGMFIYIQNINSNMIWSSAFEPCNIEPEAYKAVFSPDKVEFMRKDGNIETHTEITVSPEDNAEIRMISLTNRSEHPRVLEVTSYFEVVLAYPDEDLAHPTFSNLFVRTEYVEDYDCLLASRRPRAEKQKDRWAMHTVSSDCGIIGDIQYETDRSKFIGRNRDLWNPAAMDVDQPLTNSTGAVLDPVMSLRTRIRIEPGQTATLAFVAAVADTRKNALELAEKYNDIKAAERAFEMSWTRSQIEADYLGFKPEDVEQYLAVLPAILFPSPLRKKWADRILKNRKGQPGLWPFGISGDIPIVLVVVESRDEAELVQSALNAHEFWRAKGLAVDLVFFMEDESSYTQPLFDMIRDAVSASHARDLVDRAGGVFIRNAKVMNEDDRVLFYTAARVVIRDSVKAVLEQLAEESKELYPVPVFNSLSASRVEEGEKTIPQSNYAACNALRFFNGIGGFSLDGKEYVIQLGAGRYTPAPWINVISNGKFGFQVSESGSGYTWSENSRENKLTPWSNDPVSDPAGEVFYIRDEKDGYFWSLTPMPVKEKGNYTVRHGLGYSVFEHFSNGIEQKLIEFVPVDETVKIGIVRLRNKSREVRKLTVTFYIRPVLGVNEKVTAQYIVSQVNAKSGIILIKNVFNADFPDRTAFVCSSEHCLSCTGDRWEFIGTHGNLEEPEALKRERLSGRFGAGLDPCAAIQVSASLNPEETKEMVFLLGQGRNVDEVYAMAGKYRKVTAAKAELEKVKAFWEEKLGTIQVTTPDESMNLLMNNWLLYQVISCRIWARSAFYQSGGAYGFRDQLQDVMAAVHHWPDLVRNQILLHSRHQFVEGDVQHWWHAEAGKGIRTKYSDDLLWLPYVTADYIQNTGDLSILDEAVPYLESEPLTGDVDERYDIPRISDESSNLYEHCIRAIERSLRLGEHGIPLMGSGDWNDGMNTVGNKGKGESVWLGWFLYTVLRKFIPLCNERKDSERAEKYLVLADLIAQSIETAAWDGSWYRRAYFDDGKPLGSMQNSECRIDSISQSWSVISGVGRQKRVEEAMEAVEKHLVNREEGIIKLLAPPFDEGDLHPGYIKGYVPGVRENGGQYTHAAVWVILAFARLGQGDRAWELFHLINPINHTRTYIEYSRYKVEPYVMAADVYAIDPHKGRGGWTWYTGAAGWMYRTGIEHILGIKRAGEKLVFDPCIPKSWDGFNVRYRFGKTVYVIDFKNPDRTNKGIRQVMLDGKMVDKPEVHLADDGIEHAVEVVMGN